MVGQRFSMAADLPFGVALKVKFIGGLWGKSVSSIVNWTYSGIDKSDYSQFYESIEPGKYCDLNLGLYDTKSCHSLVIEYYIIKLN